MDRGWILIAVYKLNPESGILTLSYPIPARACSGTGFHTFSDIYDFSRIQILDSRRQILYKIVGFK